MVVASRLGAGVGFLALIAAVCAGGSAFSQDQIPKSRRLMLRPRLRMLTSRLHRGGPKEYMNNCRTCHGSKGTAGVPLAKNPKVSGNPGYLIWAILTGPGYMPEFAPVLSDETDRGDCDVRREQLGQLVRHRHSRGRAGVPLRQQSCNLEVD